MYSNLTATVRTKHGLSSCFKCSVGTRQGCILSPQIFLVFIDNLYRKLELEGGQRVFINQFFPNLCALMFADDISALSSTCNLRQKQLNALETFCNTTGMKVNFNKTKIIVFRNGGPLRQYEKWFYNGDLVETVSFYRYLGPPIPCSENN